MNKNLLIAPFLSLSLIASCGNNKPKEWKEIDRTEAIRIEANILSNFKAPKFFTSVTEFKANDKVAYSTDTLGEGYSESQKFYRSIDLHSSSLDEGWHLMVDYCRVVDNELWNLRANKYDLEKPEEQGRSKRKIETESPMDVLRNYVFINYYEYILEFESIVETISQGKTVGEFSFYSHDNDDTSLKGIIKFNKLQTNVSTYSNELQIAFENNLPSSLFVMKYIEKDKQKRTGHIVFDYSKEPYLPNDVNPTDWCDD